jgi:hypothetical protein
MLPNQMGNAMGQGSCFAAPRSRHHQQRTHMVINSSALSIVQSSQEPLCHSTTAPAETHMIA